MKKHFAFILSSILGGIFYFTIGWIAFEYLLGSYMSEHTINVQGFRKNEEESSLTMLIVSCLAYSTLLSVIFGYLSDIKTFKNGFLAGTIIGMLVAVMVDSYWYATSHFFNNLAPLVIDIGAAGLTVGLMGGVIAFVLGYVSKFD